MLLWAGRTLEGLFLGARPFLSRLQFLPAVGSVPRLLEALPVALWGVTGGREYFFFSSAVSMMLGGSVVAGETAWGKLLLAVGHSF